MQVVCSQGDRIQILREITYIKSHEMLNVVLKSKTFHYDDVRGRRYLFFIGFFSRSHHFFIIIIKKLGKNPKKNFLTNEYCHYVFWYMTHS